jgi:CheY-like chemotaxis protein
MLDLLKSPWEQNSHPVIAIIEDSDEDFYTFMRTVQSIDALDPTAISYKLLRFDDGDEALDYLLRQEDYESLQKTPLPVAILLDLNLPSTDGREIIKIIKQDPQLQTLPIVVFTTSSNPKDIQTCYQNGANGYILKPMGSEQMHETVSLVLNYWFRLSILPSHGQFLS